MTVSQPFIARPVATSLIWLAVVLSGMVAFNLLPVSPLPQVDFPTINVSASLPGASPETMASAVATPLEQQFSRIAGVTEMTSHSGTGSTSITLQFELDRDIDGAARDVQSAINAAAGELPPDLPSQPRYRKLNPADAPIMILALTSDTVSRGAMYDAASTILAQKLSQVSGVGQVRVGGSSQPAVRVDVNPNALVKYGLSLADVRRTLSATNVNQAKGQLDGDQYSWEISTNDQLFEAAYYRDLVVSYVNGAAVRLQDVAEVYDSVENIRNAGLANGKPAVLVILNRQPGANVIEVVEGVRAALPQLAAALPASIDLQVVLDQTTTIRASIHDVEMTLLLSVALVVAVVFVFLRDWRSTIIPGIAIPVSLVGTFGAMYLLGYSLNNLSLMALTIATGFVVDDAIVVVENIARHVERGMRPLEAALLGAREVGFTVLSISVSLIAVFIPVLMMGGIVGRLFREFAMTLSIAILVSLAVSLTLTPMLGAKLMRQRATARREPEHSPRSGLLRGYDRLLRWVLKHPAFTLAVFLLTLALSIHLYATSPKGFFPQQDTGRINGNIIASQDTSFQEMRKKLEQFTTIVAGDPAVQNVVGFTGSDATNTGRMFIALKPRSERDVTADQVIARIRDKTASIIGANLYLQAAQDVRSGGRASSAQYQYSLRGDNYDELVEWSQRIVEELRTLPELKDVNSDQQNAGLEATVEIDRVAAARLGVTTRMIDEALYDAFGQRQVSTMYTQLNQYYVVMGVAPEYQSDPDALRTVYVRSSSGEQIPLSTIASFKRRAAPLSITHQGAFPAITLSFNLAPGVALGEAAAAIERAIRDLGVPATIIGSFQGTAQAFRATVENQPLLIAAALLTVYIVLGILYESLIHPLTILSTLPSAGVGALLALQMLDIELSVIALIGLILLIGIVKKNAILMIDFALMAERSGKSPREAIHEACLLRFRPIMMTTAAALLGALPLALGTGTGSELRQPLGIAIVGGLILSQALTLFTTPVIYLYMERLRAWALGPRAHRLPAAPAGGQP